MVSIAPPLPPVAPPPGSTASARSASPAGQTFAGISNPSCALEVIRGIAQRLGDGLGAIGSSVRRAFEGIGNLLRGAQVAPQPAPAQAPAALSATLDMSALILASSESTMLNRLPQLTAMLQPDAPTLDLAPFKEAFRTMGAGTKGFAQLLERSPDIVPGDIAERARSLADPHLVIVTGLGDGVAPPKDETRTDVWHRIERGAEHDVAFLDAARDQLLAHVDQTKALALAFMASAGNDGFAGKLEASFAEHARKAAQPPAA